MSPTLLKVLAVVVVTATGLYLGLQGLRRGFDGNYLGYVNPDLDTARAEGLLIGEYRASCASGGAASAYVARPTKKKLGVLLVGTRIVAPDAVAVVVDVPPDGVEYPRMQFDDGAGVHLDPDGRGDESQITPADTDDADDSTCCFSYRSRVPERFWLTSDGERVCEFRFDEATRRDVPPHTRWTW